MADKHPIELPAGVGATQLEQRGLLLGDDVVWAEPGSTGYNCEVPWPPNNYHHVLLGSEQRSSSATLISFARAQEFRTIELAKLGVDESEVGEMKIVKRTVVVATTEYTEL